jgi:hypothetical protein
MKVRGPKLARPKLDGFRGTPGDEEIRCRAYEIYLERSEQPGGELDDWLQAERELGNGGV